MNNKDYITSLPNFIWNFLSAYKSWIIGLVICAAILGSWGPINALLITDIINVLATNPNSTLLTTMLFWPSLSLLLNLLAHDLTWRCWDFVNYRVQPEIKSKITQFTYKYILQQSYHFFQENDPSRITENINILTNGIEKTINRTAMHIARGLSMLTIALSTIYIINPIIFLWSAAWVGLYVAISYRYHKKIVLFADDYVGSEANVSAVILDGITNAQSIKVLSQNDYELNYLDQKLNTMRATFNKKSSFSIKNNFIQRLSLIASMSYMLYMLAHLKTHNEISIGSFVLILALTLDIGWTLWWITEQIESLADTIRHCKQSLKNLFMPLDIQDKPNAIASKITAGKIQFNNVHFSYRNSEFLLTNRSMIIPAGQKVGIVGHPGGGKTTFVNLIMRMFDVSSGSIKIDNHDIRDFTQASLHNAIDYIPQEPTLFNRTIMENIKYGNNKASEFEVILAAKRAHAHEFIETLPHKYNTILGESGIKLTGSQRQRIAIARAMLKDAPILILDEATSQLDSLIAQEIEDSLWQLMKRKTTLVISHSLSTLQLMDRILVIENGKIVEDGTHEQLLFKGDGLYNTLWNTQACGIFNDF